MKKNFAKQRSKGAPLNNGDPRCAAILALDEIESRSAYADLFLKQRWAKIPFRDDRDKALATMLVYGVLRWRNRLDAIVSHCAGRPLSKIQRALLNPLRVGVYQLVFLDRVHAGAAVSETVEAVKTLGHSKGAGFVNAVLRRTAREGGKLPESEDEIERFSLETGMPRWLIELWQKDEGPAGAALIARALSATPPAFFRAKNQSMADELLQHLKTPKAKGRGFYAPASFWAIGGGELSADEMVTSGKAVLQGQASQLIPLLLSPERGARVLDCCAAPGLKTAHIAELMDDSGEIVALDIHKKRARMVETLAQSLGYSSIKAITGDAAKYTDERPFDAALLDVPCSGLGVLAHNPERKWRISPDELSTFPALQYAIMENAAKMVRVGGVMVYSTCTTARAENEGVVKRFLAEEKGWEVEPPKDFDAPTLINEEGFFKTFPIEPTEENGEHLDGFFGARLRRTR
ncbi:MAG: hypothetical protein C0608_06795 [Deltaproteobacteria bacterium]|nr:MAG: hypothetical protein C0608_06795 [Deltaproteobacteria bacterium]